jgi:hypothetical protein
MRYRKLRIAWSVFWGVLAILLTVWWSRSYRVYDTVMVALPSSQCMELGSHFRQFNFNVGERSAELGSGYWATIHQELDGDEAEGLNLPGWFGKLGIRGRGAGGFYYFDFWFPFIGLIATAAASWLPLRFTLRTLLIATTLVAVVLGLIAWLSR